MIAIAPPTDVDQLHLRHEFLSMPGLALTVSQTARLLDVGHRHAEELLVSLEAEGFLVRTDWGTFRRAEVGWCTVGLRDGSGPF
jgi:hypothetical protein